MNVRDSMYVHDQSNNRCCQAAAGHDQCRAAESLGERRTCDSVTFPHALLLEELRQHSALLKGRGTAKGVTGSIISLLRNAQLEVELRQRKVSRETVRLKLGSLLQMIKRGIDVTGK